MLPHQVRLDMKSSDVDVPIGPQMSRQECCYTYMGRLHAASQNKLGKGHCTGALAVADQLVLRWLIPARLLQAEEGLAQRHLGLLAHGLRVIVCQSKWFAWTAHCKKP